MGYITMSVRDGDGEGEGEDGLNIRGKKKLLIMMVILSTNHYFHMFGNMF